MSILLVPRPSPPCRKLYGVVPSLCPSPRVLERSVRASLSGSNGCPRSFCLSPVTVCRFSTISRYLYAVAASCRCFLSLLPVAASCRCFLSLFPVAVAVAVSLLSVSHVCLDSSFDSCSRSNRDRTVVAKCGRMNWVVCVVHYC